MPRPVLKTPLLVPIPSTFETYLERATKRCRYEYRHAPVLNHREIDFDIDVVRYWMDLWTRQPIAGGYPRWRRYTPERCRDLYDKGILKVMFADVALQMVEVCDDYAYAHPPLYDKANPVAKSMWFGLINWCCGKVKWLDLGGGQQKRWNELKRDKHYKWLYVPKDIERKPWRVQVCDCGWRQLVYTRAACRGCRSSP